MTKKVYVTPAQKSAAKVAIKRSTASGKAVPRAVRKIADAKVRTAPAAVR